MDFQSIALPTELPDRSNLACPLLAMTATAREQVMLEGRRIAVNSVDFQRRLPGLSVRLTLLLFCLSFAVWKNRRLLIQS
jgi:hypothetical protein